VDNRLEPHVTADVKSLQGGAHRVRATTSPRQSWAPSTRWIAGIAGSALALAGLRGGLLGRLTVGALGGALLVRATTNQPTRQILGLAHDRMTPGTSGSPTITPAVKEGERSAPPADSLPPP
jgi:hypothetical protein